MKKIILKTLLPGLILFLISSPLYAEQTVVKLYEGIAPGSEEWTQKEFELSQDGGKMIFNVTDPTLTVFRPDKSKATGAAVIVAPGGGFYLLSWENEGTMVGEWLQKRGIAAFILKYRLADMGKSEAEFQNKSQKFVQQMMTILNGSNPEEELRKNSDAARIIRLARADGRQAIEYVRSNAAGYNVNPDRIGLMGFSAGGVLTMGVGLDNDAESRPDFITLIYAPVFLGNIPIPNDAGPLFITCAADDELVASRAPELYSAWKAAGKSVELHVYAKGGHGFGMVKRGLPIDTWIERFGEWLDAEGFLK